MSSSRGNSSRTRSQKYQNKTSFKNDLHDKSNRTKVINSLEINGLCKRCKEIIEWKIKYKKYKPLTVPKKCVNCDQKTIKHAYHVLCSNCASTKTVCAKCCKPIFEIDENKETVEQNESGLLTVVKALPERKRRTVLRHINKHGGVVTSELISSVEGMISQLDLEDFDNFSEPSETEDDL